MNKWQGKILLIIFIILASVSFLLWDYHKFLNTPIASNRSVNYVLKPGACIKTLAFDLYRHNELQHPYYLILLAYLKHKTTCLKAGEYEFIAGTKPLQMLEQVAAGHVVIHRITFIEGWTVLQIRDALAKETHLKHILQSMDDATLLKQVGAENYPSLEGLLFPDTYSFTANTTDLAILQRAYQKMQQVVAEEWPERASFVAYHTPYEALIVASLVEKETRLAVERPIVADVIVQRLQKGMPLQIDSTLIYGLGHDYQGSLHKKELQRDTAYNSYIHRGLPPTPIANPGKAALLAALHPWPSKVLYFVARGDGSQQFSSTLKDHQKAVAKFIHKPVKVKDKPVIMQTKATRNPCSLSDIGSYGMRLICEGQ